MSPVERHRSVLSRAAFETPPSARIFLLHTSDDRRTTQSPASAVLERTLTRMGSPGGEMAQPSYVHGASSTPLIGETIGVHFDKIVERRRASVSQARILRKLFGCLT
jgi:hypothetical protein